MKNEIICFRITEIEDYDTNTGKFNAKAVLHTPNKVTGAMEPCYTLATTGRRVEAVVTITGQFFCRPNRCDFYTGLVGAREEDDIPLIRMDRMAPDTVDLLRVFLPRFIKRVRSRKKILKDFQAGGFKSFQDFVPNLPQANVDDKAIQDIRCNLKEHEQYTQLLKLLETVDCSFNSAAELFIKYKDETENVLKTTPFKAFSEGILGWLDADKLYLYFKHNPGDHMRCKTAVRDVLQSAAKYRGSVCVALEELVDLAADRLNRDSVETFAKTEIERIVREECGVIIEQGFGNAVYLPEQHSLERKLAYQFQRIQSGAKRTIRGCTPMALRAFFYEHSLPGNIKLSEEQVTVIETALTHPITVIHGEAGSGKTVTVRGLVDAIQYFAPWATIRLCAPTGKAARHLASVTGMKTTTLHSLIFDIEHTRKSPEELSHLDFILIDEAAMLDNSLVYELLEKLDPACRIILTGDANQLPSIGPGVVFKQLLEAETIMSLKLSQVFRQKNSSDILRLAHDIVQFKDNSPPIDLYSYSGDVEFIKCKTAGETCAAVERIIQSLLSSGESPNSIQVLSPIKGKTLGTRSLNQSLANLMNVSRTAQKDNWSGVCVGDKVIQGANLYEDGKMSVYNGAVGEVTKIIPEKKKLYVDFYDNDTGEICYDSRTVGMLEPAYATTVHKFQGSEVPYVILPMDASFHRMLNRQLMYTAVTRAKMKLFIIGDEQSFRDAVEYDVLQKRSSHLSERMGLAVFAA